MEAVFSASLLSLFVCVCRNRHGIIVKNLPAHAGDTGGWGSIPGSRRSPGGGNGYPLQHSCLENSMDRGAWCARVHEVTRIEHDLLTKPPPLVTLEVWLFLTISNMQLPCDPTMEVWAFIPEKWYSIFTKNLYTNINSSFIYNNSKLEETAHMPNCEI